MLKKYKINPQISAKKVKIEFNRIGFLLTDIENTYKGSEAIKIYTYEYKDSDMEVLYVDYSKSKDESYFQVKLPGNNFYVSQENTEDLEEQLDYSETLLRLLRTMHKFTA